MDDDILVQEEIYYIRKTKHKLRYGIYINQRILFLFFYDFMSVYRQLTLKPCPCIYI